MHKPQFTATLDTRSLVDDHNRPWLLCDKEQIPDKKLVRCVHYSASASASASVQCRAFQRRRTGRERVSSLCG